MLIVLVGARGAGKTTLLRRLATDGVATLQPSTTRSKRSPSEAEYDFVTSWDDKLYAWGITVGVDRYGMRRSELARAETLTAVTVFEPESLDVFEGVRRSFPFATITVGLDTVTSTVEQHARVGHAPDRMMDDAALKAVREIILTCDVVLTGSQATVHGALKACIATIEGRHGVLTKELLSPLMAAGSVLTEVDDANIRSASYDLRIGGEVWCQGQVHTLNDVNPRFQIPPYSYAIVSAFESARLPPFMVGRFDLKVSYFFEGIILSNGPQVDPGYKGALFCMLYNGSGRGKIVTFKKQFATIDFTTTATVTEGYKQKYQFQQRMDKFMTDDALVGTGGAIVELIESKVSVVDRKVDSINSNFWIIAAAFIALMVVAPAITVPVLWTEIATMHTDTINLQDSQKKEEYLIAEAKEERKKLQASVQTVNPIIKGARPKVSRHRGKSARSAPSRSATSASVGN